MDDVPNLPSVAQSKFISEELQLAKKLIEQLSGSFRHESYKNEYIERLIEAIQNKIQPKTKVLDLLSAL